MTTEPIDQYSAVIDSRDVIARIAELQELLAKRSWDVSRDERTELAALLELDEHGSQYPDWKYGTTLIHNFYFKKYAKELAAECGMIKDPEQWPHTCIDWDKAVEELQMDYVEVEYVDQIFWIRA